MVLSAHGGRHGMRTQFREESGQLGHPRGSETLQHLIVPERFARPERVDVWTERQDLFCAVATADEQPPGSTLRLNRDLFNESTLADPSLSGDQDHPPPAVGGRRQVAMNLLHLRPATNEGRLGRRDDADPLASRPRVLPTQDLQVQLARGRFRLRVELSLEHPDAHLVLPECRGAPTLAIVETHEGSVRRLLERIKSEQAQPRLNGNLGGAGLHLVAQQPGEPLQGKLTQALALDDEPLLERRFSYREPLEKVASIEDERSIQRLRR